MDYKEKINIYVSAELKAQIQNDAMYFEIFKNNHREININRFLSLFLCGYYDRYTLENYNSHQAIIDVLKDHDLSEAEQFEVADRILKKIAIPTDEEFQSKKSVAISLKPTSETHRILNSIENVLGGRDTKSQYIRRMLISYFQKAMWQREQIIFNENYQCILESCKTGKPLLFSYIWEKNTLHKVTPYKVVSGTDGMFNYLICIETNPRSGNQEVRSYRLNRIDMVSIGYASQTVSKELKMLCEKTIATAPQYAINTNVEICVKLNDDGEKLYNRIYFGRPKYSRVEDKDDGHYYYFECSEEQVFHYFRRFDNGKALVLTPDKLVQRMSDFYHTAAKAYEKGEK